MISFIGYLQQPKMTNFTPLPVVLPFCQNNGIYRFNFLMTFPPIHEPDKIQVKLDSSDLKWQYMRASGAGGQGVNTADSAVRGSKT